MAGGLTLFAVLLLLGHSATASICVITGQNKAENRPATQSSTALGGVASRAVDGNRFSRFSGNSCTHTQTESNPWWRVDLGSSQCVAWVRIYNREDCCQERLDGFTVHVGDNPDVLANPTCPGGPFSISRRTNNKGINCGGLTGRYVGVALRGSGRVLTLCEVQVFGESRGRKRGGYYGALTGAQDNDLEMEALEEDALEKKAWEEEALEEDVLEKKAWEEEALEEDALEEAAEIEGLKEEVLEEIEALEEAALEK
ncbi:fucolectin-like isoform X2 [Branchiostoma floridae x Branchiostoma belcheri]